MQKYITRATLTSSSVFVCRQLGGAVGESYGSMMKRYSEPFPTLFNNEETYETIGLYLGSCTGLMIAVGGIALLHHRNTVQNGT